MMNSSAMAAHQEPLYGQELINHSKTYPCECLRATANKWVAENHPELVREIADRGYEIASHGHRHQLVYQQTKEEFREELRRAQDAIHEACGVVPGGFRAPGFSIRRDCLWALDVLSEEGFAYDSSIFPAWRSHGGIPGAGTEPWRHENGLLEFPVSTAGLGSCRIAYMGGGYLRFFPQWLIGRIADLQSSREKPLILYVHPRDIDPGQPRLKLNPWRNFKTYFGLSGCQAKLGFLLDEFEWGAFADSISPHDAGQAATAEPVHDPRSVLQEAELHTLKLKRACTRPDDSSKNPAAADTVPDRVSRDLTDTS